MDGYDDPGFWNAWIESRLDEPVRQYLREIGGVTRLSEDETVALLPGVLGGDFESKLRLSEIGVSDGVKVITPA